MRNRTALMMGLALIGALFIGYIDSRASEVLATLMIMLPIAFALGFIEPRRAWLWALIIGLSVPVTYLFVLSTGQRYADPPSGYMTLIALLPAFVASYAGVVLRKLFGQATISL